VLSLHLVSTASTSYLGQHQIYRPQLSRATDFHSGFLQ
jgi:hypothetical protein